jgi:hypothetical protein
MLSYSRSVQTPQPAFENVHSLGEIPKSALLYDLLQPLEKELSTRKMLRALPNTLHPIWFFAETERNIYLWRRGLSLSQAELFEFWIDIAKLIDKRRDQLKRYNSENPFLNPLWGMEQEHADSAIFETAYLEDLEAALKVLGPHAHALSYAGSLLNEERRCSKPMRAVLPG